MPLHLVPTSQQTTLDQRRASLAWQAIQSLEKLPDRDVEQRDDMVRQAKKLPVRIMASGLGQALAFLFAKSEKKPGTKDLLQLLKYWLVTETQLVLANQNANEDLLVWLLTAPSDQVRLATAETLALAQWFNRFAEGKFKVDTTESN